tara:strand:+ start:3139 stop:3654 length:516 start_codon:yes stop_codon:yes gene_type:complete
MTSETTPLSSLPNNTETDSDLVNKILNQLETTNESDAPTFEIEKPPEPVQVINKVPEPQPVVQKAVNQPTIVESPNKHQDKSVNNLSPQGIQNMINVFDMDYINKVGKFALLLSILFFIFISCNSTFVNWFSKVPSLKAVTLANELNNTGKILQSICFGIVYFLLKLFINN